MIAFLVLAHDRPKHAVAVAESLRSPASQTFMHVDAKSDLAPFKECERAGAVLISERHKVYWGGFSQVSATLSLIRHALKVNVCFTHFALLTGSCYPLATTEAMARFLTESGQEFIDNEQIREDPADLNWQRMLKIQLDGGRRVSGIRGRLVREINQHILGRLPDRDVKAIGGSVSFFRGSAYWVLSRGAIEQIMEFEKRHKRIVGMLSRSICPDEIFFHTAAMAGPSADRVSGSLTYSRWFPDGSGPALVDDEIASFVTTPRFRLTDGGNIRPAFFVRKLPDDADAVRERLDDYRKKRTDL